MNDGLIRPLCLARGALTEIRLDLHGYPDIHEPDELNQYHSGCKHAWRKKLTVGFYKIALLNID
jgi:hypothetical protein